MSSEIIQKQPKVISLLKAAVEKDRLPHALLFVGPKDAGQAEIAFWLTQVIFCGNKKGVEPCGECLHCRKVDKKIHPDLHFIEPEEDSRFIKIEAARQLIGKTYFKPFEANAKVFVIHDAETMNETAQNALLKTLEEPPGKTFFILITSNPGGLLLTIRSRAQNYHFAPAAHGRLSDPEVEESSKKALEFILSGLSEGAPAPDLSKLDRETLGVILDELIEYFRDVLLLRVGAGEIAGAIEDKYRKEELAQSLDEETLEAWIEILAEFKEKILENIHVKLALSVLWDRLKERVYAG